MRQGRGLPFCAPGKKSHFRPFSDCIKSGNYTTSSSINEMEEEGGRRSLRLFPIFTIGLCSPLDLCPLFCISIAFRSRPRNSFFTHPEIPLSIKQQYLVCFNVAIFKESYRIHGTIYHLENLGLVYFISS